MALAVVRRVAGGQQPPGFVAPAARGHRLGAGCCAGRCGVTGRSAGHSSADADCGVAGARILAVGIKIVFILCLAARIY